MKYKCSASWQTASAALVLISAAAPAPISAAALVLIPAAALVLSPAAALVLISAATMPRICSLCHFSGVLSLNRSNVQLNIIPPLNRTLDILKRKPLLFYPLAHCDTAQTNAATDPQQAHSGGVCIYLVSVYRAALPALYGAIWRYTGIKKPPAITSKRPGVSIFRAY